MSDDYAPELHPTPTPTPGPCTSSMTGPTGLTYYCAEPAGHDGLHACPLPTGHQALWNDQRAVIRKAD